MRIDNKFNLKDVVYLKTDEQQKARIVTAITVKPNDLLIYEISCGADNSNHYDFEISAEIDVMITTRN